MTVSIHLPDEQMALLKAKAQALGVSAEQYAQQVLEENLRREQATSRARRPISQVITDIMADTPHEELSKLPADGASEHDHYLYGWPKRKH